MHGRHYWSHTANSLCWFVRSRLQWNNFAIKLHILKKLLVMRNNFLVWDGLWQTKWHCLARLRVSKAFSQNGPNVKTLSLFSLRMEIWPWTFAFRHLLFASLCIAEHLQIFRAHHHDVYISIALNQLTTTGVMKAFGIPEYEKRVAFV